MRAAGMVRNRVKAFTDTFVGGHDGGTLGRRSSHWGHHGEAPCPLPRGALGVKTSSFYGCVLMVKSCIKVRLDSQAYKSTVVAKGSFFPYV
jgi:hypothetical protein